MRDGGRGGHRDRGRGRGGNRARNLGYTLMNKNVRVNPEHGEVAYMDSRGVDDTVEQARLK
jgi:hypothetical protein